MHRPSRRRGSLRLLALALVLALGCDRGPQEPERKQVVLPLRAHVLASTITTLDAESGDSEIRALLRETNQIWAQAGIRWEPEEIERDSIPKEGERLLLEARDTGQPLPPDFFRRFLPLDSFREEAWNVFVVHDVAFMGARGIYIPFVPAILTSETAPRGLRTEIILAHELGHSLGLTHVPCGEKGNLMALPFCEVGKTRLTEQQIRRVREQALRGVPATSLDSVAAARWPFASN